MRIPNPIKSVLLLATLISASRAITVPFVYPEMIVPFLDYNDAIISGSASLFLFGGELGVAGGANSSTVDRGEWMEFSFPKRPGVNVSFVFACAACDVTVWEANGHVIPTFSISVDDAVVDLNSRIGVRYINKIRVAPTSEFMRFRSFNYATADIFPVLTKLTPASLPAGGPEVSLLLDGSNFQEGAAVTWDGVKLPTTRISTTQLRVALLPSLTSQVRDHQVTVVNGGEYGSSILTLAVQTASSAAPATPVGSFAHLAVGESWESSITLLNSGSQTATVGLVTYDELGRIATLTAANGAGSNSIAGHGAKNLKLIDGPAPGLFTGSAQLSATGPVNGFNLFRWRVNGQEAVVPLMTQVSPSYTLAFDNTLGNATGIAVANATDKSGTITVVTRNEQGIRTGNASISLRAHEHLSFLLPDRYSETKNARGTIEFVTPDNGSISVIGLNFAPSGAFSTLPPLTPPNYETASFAHLAAGGDWESTVTLVSISDKPAYFQIRLFDESGQPLPVNREVSSGANSLVRGLDARGVLRIKLTGPEDQPVRIGSAQIITTDALSGFVTFRWKVNGQEASVPIEGRQPASYLMAFDNTGGSVAGFAISSESATAADVPVIVRDESGASLGSGAVALAGNGHVSFVLTDQYPLTAGKRGTIEFTVPSGKPIRALGIRSSPTGALTTIPAVAN